MMKTMLKNKKSLLIAIVILAVLASGITYAWFVITSSQSVIVDVGDLAITTTLVDDPNNPEKVEPGIEITKEGTVQNTGSLPSVLMLNYTADTTIKSDDNGKPLHPEDYALIKGDPNIAIKFDEDKLCWDADEEGTYFYTWMAVKSEPDKYVLIMYGNPTVKLAYDIAFNGKNMGNKYMKATASFDTEWTATQALDGALEDTFGFDYSGLEEIQDLPQASGTRMLRDSGITYAEVMAKVAELFGH